MRIKLNTVKGKYILSRLSIGEYDESKVEHLYGESFFKMSQRLEISKIRVESGKTDGFLTIRKCPGVYGLQETKKDLPATENSLKKQLLQALTYSFSIESEHEKSVNFFILNSEKYFCVILRKDIEDLIDVLREPLSRNEFSGSKTWNNLELRKIMKEYKLPHVFNMLTNELNLTKVMKEVFDEF